MARIFGDDKKNTAIYLNLLLLFFTFEYTSTLSSTFLPKQSSTEVSGFVSYDYYKTKYTSYETRKQQLLKIKPIVSYFFIDDLSFGLKFSYHYQKIDYESIKDHRTTEKTFIGPITKYYLCQEKFRPFLVTDYLFLIGDDYERGLLGIGGGALYHITGNFGISIQVKYGQIWSRKDEINS